MAASRVGAVGVYEELSFNGEWSGQTYAMKQVRPIFVDEANEIVVVTVYTYFSQEELSP